jgi:hypothetical protein
VTSPARAATAVNAMAKTEHAHRKLAFIRLFSSRRSASRRAKPGSSMQAVFSDRGVISVFVSVSQREGGVESEGQASQ